MLFEECRENFFAPVGRMTSLDCSEGVDGARTRRTKDTRNKCARREHSRGRHKIARRVSRISENAAKYEVEADLFATYIPIALYVKSYIIKAKLMIAADVARPNTQTTYVSNE